MCVCVCVNLKFLYLFKISLSIIIVTSSVSNLSADIISIMDKGNIKFKKRHFF